MSEQARSADRGYFGSIAVYMLVSLAVCVFPLVVKATGGDIWAIGHGRQLLSLIPIAFMFPVGVVMLLCGVWRLVGRLRNGPMKPGEHARY